MTGAVFLTLGILATLFVFPYVLYAPMVRLFSRLRDIGVKDVDDSALPPITILIPAHNEATHMRAKLENTLHLHYPADRVAIVVCSDGSDDGTDEIVESYAEQGVRHLRNYVRRGKARTVNRLIAEARTEFVFLTDASAMMNRDSLRRMVSVAIDPDVGVAEARYVIRRTADAGTTEQGYWNAEARVRAAESERGMLLGASGAGYVLRRELMPYLPADTINDDYIVPLNVAASGKRVIYVPTAEANDSPTESGRALYYRWVRIAFGNWQMLMRYIRLLAPWRPRTAFPLFRKLMRTAGPLLLVAMAVVVTKGRHAHPLLSVLAWAGWSGLLLGAMAALVPLESRLTRYTIVRALRYATLAQTAYLHGFARFCLGSREGIWQRPAAPELHLDAPGPLPTSVRLAKRTLDILAAVVGIALFGPIMLMVAIAVKLESHGPVIYRQERMRPDFDGSPVPFAMLKFRSMSSDAEDGTGPVWAASTGDLRVTRVGKFIRRYRLDELPQFFNVLRGEMSLVGPRPERPFFVDQLTEAIPGYNDRLRVLKPGITGWAQVQVGYDTSVDSVREKVLHDLAYLAHMYRLSTYLKMELTVIVRTVGVMLKGTGSA